MSWRRVCADSSKRVGVLRAGGVLEKVNAGRFRSDWLVSDAHSVDPASAASKQHRSRKAAQGGEGAVQVVRLPVDKPKPAVTFLHERSRGVMDLIAHFWERLPQTPPLLRADLHLLIAVNDESTYENISSGGDTTGIVGAMLYVPKAHRADVLAITSEAAEAFSKYILTNSEAAIDFLTGSAEGLGWMVPHLLPAVKRKTVARQLTNVVMQLPLIVESVSDVDVRTARDGDLPSLNRWRRLYKEERGILFDADMDAWIDTGRIFVLIRGGEIVAVAKLDLALPRLVEIGGVFTFPEHRKLGYGAKLVSDLATRIRALGKVPTLQVDMTNGAAHTLYKNAGWVEMGRLGRVWLKG